MSRGCVACVGAVAWIAGCTPDTEAGVAAVDVEGVTVFVREAEPVHFMDALTGGPVQVEDGCLTVAGDVPVWRPSQLSTVRSLVGQVQQGEALSMQLGGGEWGRTEDLVGGIGEGCPGRTLWSVGDVAGVVNGTAGR